MGKKAVITTGGKQYLVQEGESLSVELIKPGTAGTGGDKTDKGGKTGKTVNFEPLLVIDGDSVAVGAPTVAKAIVTAEVIEADVQADKVTSIRYKAKKRVHTVKGHRQHQTVLKITKIA